nr:hypothetical protein [Tanacetum cinerariifolium]
PSDTPVCYLCTCEQCGNILNYGTCLNCNSGIGNSLTYDTIPESFDEVQIIPNPPPQFHFNIYLYQICESNSHYGYECSQQISLVYEPEPCYTQNFSENDYSHDLPSVNPLIDHHCCFKCGNSLNDFFCHHCTCEFCGNGAHVGYNFPAQVLSFQTLPCFLQQYPCCEDCGGLPETDHCQPPQYTVNHPIFNAHNDFLNSQNKITIAQNKLMEQMTQLTSMCEMVGIDETDCDPENDIRLIERLLYDNSSPRPPKEFVSENSNAEIESFSPYPIPVKDSDSLMEEIDLFLNPDYPILLGIEEDDDDSERDILILEKLLDNYSLSLPVIKSYHFDIPSFSRPPSKPPDGNTRILNIKMMGDNSEQKVPMPRLMITLVPNQEKSPDLFSHRSLEIFQLSAKFPLMILGKNIPILDVPLFHFYPLDQLKYGGN